jgi:hypothetical protein
LRSIKINTDRLVGLTAMFVAVASLVALVYQTHLMRQAQYASVLPYLTFVVVSNNELGSSLSLRNTGIGPALIEDVRIHYKDKEIEADPVDFYMSYPDKAWALGLNTDKVQRGRLIPAGEWVGMLGAKGPADDPQAFGVELLKLFEVAEVPRAWYAGAKAEGGDKAVVEIIYASVYGDRWRVRSDRLVPDEL